MRSRTAKIGSSSCLRRLGGHHRRPRRTGTRRRRRSGPRLGRGSARTRRPWAKSTAPRRSWNTLPVRPRSAAPRSAHRGSRRGQRGDRSRAHPRAPWPQAPPPRPAQPQPGQPQPAQPQPAQPQPQPAQPQRAQPQRARHQPRPALLTVRGRQQPWLGRLPKRAGSAPGRRPARHVPASVAPPMPRGPVRAGSPS